MKKTCLGFPIKKGRIRTRHARSLFGSFYISGLVDFKLSDYDKFNFKVGDLASDCDGLNHRIAKIKPYYGKVALSKYGKVLMDFTFVKEDGTDFCHAQAPITKQEVLDMVQHLKDNAANDEWKFYNQMEEKYGKDFVVNDDGTINHKGKA